MRSLGNPNLDRLSKQERVREYVRHHATHVFRIRNVRAALPGVSDPTIRLVLRQMHEAKEIEIDPIAGGTGPQAAWARRQAEGRNGHSQGSGRHK